MSAHEITKALEVWTLQSLLNLSILLGILAGGLALIQDYYRSLESRLSLRVSTELWRVGTIVIVDGLLAAVVLVGYLVLNPDVLADIKVAVPFQPAATVLFAWALCLRLFCGAHEPGGRNHHLAQGLVLAANAVNIVGFTFVMEAASGEYLALHPSPAWTWIKTHLRSNADPRGLELAQTTFLICFPLLLLVLVRGAYSAVASKRGNPEA